MYRTCQTKPIQSIPLEVEKYNLDITALSETKKKRCGEEVLGNYSHLWSEVEKG
jgi:hypothetical protein